MTSLPSTCTTAIHLHVRQAELNTDNPSYRRHLERAFEIGDFRRTGIDDGNLARILWKQASIMASDSFDPSFVPRERTEKRSQAELMRTAVERKVRANVSPRDTEEIGYDKLVCGYYR